MNQPSIQQPTPLTLPHQPATTTSSRRRPLTKTEEATYENLLNETYSIDEESFHEEDEEINNSSSNSSSPSKVPASTFTNKETLYMNVINSIKDNDYSKTESILKSSHAFQIVNRVFAEGFNPIQYATLYSHVDIIKLLIQHGASIKCQVEGLPLLHLSLTFAMFNESKTKAIECFNYLYTNYYSELCCERDRLGRSIYHLIVQFDIDEVLIDKEIDIESVVGLIDNNGQDLLSYFYIYNSHKCFKTLLDKSNTLSDIVIKHKDFIEKCFVYNAFAVLILTIDNTKQMYKKELITQLQKISSFYETYYQHTNIVTNITNLLSHLEHNISLTFNITHKKTLLVYNTSCESHIKLPDDYHKRIKKRNELFENSDRLNMIISEPFGIIHNESFKSNPTIIYESTNRQSSLIDILKCHDIEYINNIKQKCSLLIGDDNKEHVLIDSDTYISKSTYDNIYNTTGCVFEAIDAVMTGKTSNSFAIIRPPGHHVGYYGAVDVSPLPKSNGFCVVNNVCIGAAYCMYTYKDIIKKVAIVDFDVHHGNGTEEIIQLLNNKTYTHEISNNNICKINLTKTLTHPWVDFKDAENVLFISLHYYNETNPKAFYPYTGSADTNTKKNSEIYPGGILNIPFNANMKYSHDYRNAFRTKVVPRLFKFEPDIIFVSAGFDGHENENINGGNMLLQEYDYAFITEQLQYVANKFCKGRLVSVLEGGYNVKTGIVSSFAQSVMTHARFLNIAINKEDLGDVMLTKIKREREYEKDLECFKRIERFDIKPRRSERIRNLGGSISNISECNLNTTTNNNNNNTNTPNATTSKNENDSINNTNGESSNSKPNHIRKNTLTNNNNNNINYDESD